MKKKAPVVPTTFQLKDNMTLMNEMKIIKASKDFSQVDAMAKYIGEVVKQATDIFEQCEKPNLKAAKVKSSEEFYEMQFDKLVSVFQSLMVIPGVLTLLKSMRGYDKEAKQVKEAFVMLKVKFLEITNLTNGIEMSMECDDEKISFSLKKMINSYMIDDEVISANKRRLSGSRSSLNPPSPRGGQSTTIKNISETVKEEDGKINENMTKFKHTETKYSTSLDYMVAVFNSLQYRKDCSEYYYLYFHFENVKVQIMNELNNRNGYGFTKYAFVTMLNYLYDLRMVEGIDKMIEEFSDLTKIKTYDDKLFLKVKDRMNKVASVKKGIKFILPLGGDKKKFITFKKVEEEKKFVIRDDERIITLTYDEFNNKTGKDGSKPNVQGTVEVVADAGSFELKEKVEELEKENAKQNELILSLQESSYQREFELRKEKYPYLIGCKFIKTKKGKHIQGFMIDITKVEDAEKPKIKLPLQKKVEGKDKCEFVEEEFEIPKEADEEGVYLKKEEIGSEMLLVDKVEKYGLKIMKEDSKKKPKKAADKKDDGKKKKLTKSSSKKIAKEEKEDD